MRPGCRDGLPTFFQTFESPGYRPDTVLMFGSQLENTDLIPGEGEFVRAWNAKYAWPRLQLATFRDYFEIIEKRFGDQLDTVRGDFGPYWEDGIGTDAQYAAHLPRHRKPRAGGRETLFAGRLAEAGMGAAARQAAAPVARPGALRRAHLHLRGGYSRPESEESVRQIDTKHFDVNDARETAHWIAQESMSRLMDTIRIAPPPWWCSIRSRTSAAGWWKIDLDNGMQLVDTETSQPAALESCVPGTDIAACDSWPSTCRRWAIASTIWSLAVCAGIAQAQTRQHHRKRSSIASRSIPAAAPSPAFSTSRPAANWSIRTALTCSINIYTCRAATTRG